MPEYEVVPAFDEELNKRLNADEEPEVQSTQTVADIIRQAVEEERMAIIDIIKDWEDNTRDGATGYECKEDILAKVIARGETDA